MIEPAVRRNQPSKQAAGMRRRNAILLQIYEYYGQQPIKMTNFYLCYRFFIVGKTPYAIITSYHPFAVPATPEARQKAYGDIRVACCGKQRIYAAACQRHLKSEEPSPHVSRKVKMREWRLSDRNAGKRMDDDVNVKIIYQIKPRQQPALQNPTD